MTTVLIAVTLVSVAAALASIASVAFLIRSERDRSEARVAALAAAIGTHTRTADETPATLAREMDALAEFDRERAAPDYGLPSGTGRLAGASIAAGQLFAASHDTHEPLRQKWLVLGASTVIAAIALGSTFLTGEKGSEPRSAATATRSAPPLELVSLRHTHHSEALTIAGLVRNPRAASKRDNIQAVVFAFDAGGALVTSARAPLADSSLSGGVQTPFSITIPQAAGIRRYRVSFRSGEHVLPHVDRRREPPAGESTPAS